MKSKYIHAGILTAGLLLIIETGGCAGERQEQAELQSRAKISKEQAEATAMAKVPNGTIKEAELEKEHGLLIWSCDLSTPNSSDTTEVNVNAVDGTLVNVETETAKDKD